jgi:galactokinase/mevalonate kinase-like predicted kinase
LIVSTAPGRCGIVGNPTDMYGGSVVSISTRERARCTLAPCDALTLAASGATTTVLTTTDLQKCGDKLDILRAALAYFEIDPTTARFSLEVSTEIPMQAGMAGSTAMVVAVVGALDRHFGWSLHPWAVAETARKIEYRVMGVLCGFQDQHMAVFGGLNFMDFAGKERLEQRDDEPLATIEPLVPHVTDVPLLAANTGLRHHSGTVHKSPRQRWLEGDPEVIDAYCRIAQLARLGKRALLDQDWPALGSLMDKNHEIVAGLGGSGPVNDRLIEAARKAGAYGAKLAGAGGGGTVLALTDDPERVGAAVREAGAERLLHPVASPGLTVEERP